jgi:hypothetical protein
MRAALVGVVTQWRANVLGAVWIIAALGAGLAPGATAGAAEPCANEQARQESDSTKLPDCRAYELVSPGNAGGQVEYQLSLNEIGNEPQPGLARGLNGPNISNEGDLSAQLRGPLAVSGNGEDVFWDSTATPAGTGAIADGGEYDAFRSARTPSGWGTTDLLPSGVQSPAIGGIPKAIVGVSTDGSTALVLTSLAVEPSVFANPQEAGNSFAFVIFDISSATYRCRYIE